MAKRKKSQLDEVMEMLRFYNAKEITKEDLKKDPKLRESIESDRKWVLQNAKLTKITRRKLEATLTD